MEETNREQFGPPPAAEAQAGVQVAPEPVEDETARQPEMSREARNMAMLCHLLGIIGFFAPLMIWLIEREKHRFVDEHGRQAMNYQVSLLLYYLVSTLLAPLIIGLFMLGVLTVLHIVLAIIAAVQAGQGKLWRYPIAISFLK
ncbi:MAG: DUF4870 domain-containing protein [Sedimentisphaerales bacterium]|nr:DUF4870 domain-containing protein [Sedimentisphaerales bacterium]